MSKTKVQEQELFTADPEERSTPKPRARRTRKLKTIEPQSKGAVVPLPPPAPTNMLQIIAQAAANPAVDTGKMRELLQMQKEIREEEARIAFTEAKVAMALELPIIDRDGCIKIEKHGKLIQETPYSTFENMMEVVRPILTKHGFDFYAEPDEGNEQAPIVMRGHLNHVGGHGVTCAIPLPFETSGSKNNVQGIGSSLQYGRRYCLISLCSIISRRPGDSDTDGNAPVEPKQTIDGSQAKALLKAINDSGIKLDRFLKHYEIKAPHELPSASFDEALKSLANYKREREAREAKEKVADNG